MMVTETLFSEDTYEKLKPLKAPRFGNKDKSPAEVEEQTKFAKNLVGILSSGCKSEGYQGLNKRMRQSCEYLIDRHKDVIGAVGKVGVRVQGNYEQVRVLPGVLKVLQCSRYTSR
jgi:hypothetical protein